ncbi:helix-turn-helix transcriptional regulator [Kutzneria viridogrisea]|uniref:Transcriptional regulator with XRE-family HTH domain n=1 Tax=Kutzneria viridogrisea TaxID=47990 RepID=A0ABR6BAX7_9PSEU|nr:transcriptional regulator with XRE-family HTH domain [Kutzneria viridogrisea]
MIEESVSNSFEADRLAFGDKLRRLREAAELDGKDLAARLGWHASKVSKIERGKQTPSDSDLVDLLAVLEVPESAAEALRSELRELRLKQLSWRRQLRAGHRDRQRQDLADELSASTIRAVDMMAVPGLLQTPDYTRAILTTQSELLDVPAVGLDEAVAERMKRAQVLYDSSKQITILIAEAALLHPVCTPGVMAVQVDRLVSATSLPTVRVGVIPAYRPLPVLLPHGYWIVDDVVSVEHIAGELRITDAEQVAIYNRHADILWSAAAEGDEARAILLGCGRHWAELAR